MSGSREDRWREQIALLRVLAAAAEAEHPQRDFALAYLEWWRTRGAKREEGV